MAVGTVAAPEQLMGLALDGRADLRSAQRTALLRIISKSCEMGHLSTSQAESSGNTLCLYRETWLTVTERSAKNPAVLA